MAKCWAHTLGDCDSNSGEHIFSNSIFKAGCACPLIVQGVPRIRGGEATRGAEKSNILCRLHNSLLSPLDSAVGKVARFQAAANDEGFAESLYVEGELLERWLLKTAVNVAASGWMGMKWRPSEQIVRAIFGLEAVPNRMGLYSVDGIDPNHRPSGGASFTPIYLPSDHGNVFAGAYVTVHGMPLLASFFDDLASLLEAGASPALMNKFSETGLRHLYHPGAIVMSRKRGTPVFVGLSWNGMLRFADGSTRPYPEPRPG